MALSYALLLLFSPINLWGQKRLNLGRSTGFGNVRELNTYTVTDELLPKEEKTRLVIERKEPKKKTKPV